MISDAIVDCYNESEQAMGLFTMVEENLRLPFSTTVLGIQVNVQKVEVKNLLESDYPPPQVVALRPIRGCATADSVTYFQASLPLLCLKA